jgi:enoyl-CoA hydratase/E-phenylitaconyl-CoA hydratase/naphthyl-2-hydroxymethylsuccinyl-CoA hydratase
MNILLTDEPFGAQGALRIALINEVMPHAQLMERAETMARHVCSSEKFDLRLAEPEKVRRRRRNRPVDGKHRDFKLVAR